MGSGAAGLTGAVVAALGGARVTVLEKSDLVGGTTAMSGGGAWIACNPHMAEAGVADSREEALAYLRACAGELAEEELLAAIVDNGPDMVRLLEGEAGLTFQVWPAVGGTLDYRPWLPGAKPGGRTIECTGISMAELGPWAERLRKEPRLRSGTNLLDYYANQMHLLAPGQRPARGAAEVDVYWRGTALVAQLLRACLEQGVEFLLETPATQLLVEQARVVGVKATRGGESIALHAPHVLMASGGYTNNAELKRLWLDRPLDYTCDIPSNQGDGHLMGAAIGAQLAGLGDAWWNPFMPLGLQSDVVNAAGTREDRALPHTLIVNSQGKRFMNEALNYYDAGKAFGTKAGAEPRNFPAWFVFDSRGVERYALLAWKVPPGDRPEWLHVARSIDDLAGSIGVDPRAFAATIERFNGFAQAGVDEDFGRGESEWDRAWGDPANRPNPSLGPVAQAPFYAMPIYPGAIATRGGLRIDAKGRVLSVGGQPIPGLYASGNCSNGAAPGGYCGPGATIGPAMTFGYIAGRQVVGALAAR